MQKPSLIDLFISLSWKANLFVALAVYIGIGYGLPLIEFQHSAFKGMASAISQFAWVWSFLFVFLAGISALNSWHGKHLLSTSASIEAIQDLSWKEFERLVGEIFRQSGYLVKGNVSGGPDGGVDLRLEKGSETVLVQCKHWKTKRVGVAIVRELFGVVSSEKAAQGIVVASGDFTDEAKSFAKESGVELIDGRILLSLQQKLSDVA